MKAPWPEKELGGKMEVKLLSDGYFYLDTGFLVYGKAAYYGKPYKAALKSMLIKTDEDIILLDTGMGEFPKKYGKYYKIEQENTLLHQLAQEGITPQDITAIINTHLHWDHVGWNKSFPNATTYVQTKELDYAYDPHRFQKAAYIDDFFDGLDFVTINGDYTFSDAVDIIFTPGHTPGHQSVVVHSKTDYIFCGDVAPLEENLEKRNIVGVLYNPVDALKSLDRLRKIEGTHIFSHDNEQMKM